MLFHLLCLKWDSLEDARLPVAQSQGLVNSCLHAEDNQGNVVVGFTSVFLPFLMRYDG